jgi:hypothetical protein
MKVITIRIDTIGMKKRVERENPYVLYSRKYSIPFNPSIDG